RRLCGRRGQPRVRRLPAWVPEWRYLGARLLGLRGRTPQSEGVLALPGRGLRSRRGCGGAVLPAERTGRADRPGFRKRLFSTERPQGADRRIRGRGQLGQADLAFALK